MSIYEYDEERQRQWDREEGRETGREEGEARYARLVERLLAERKLDELKRTTEDKTNLRKLYEEYNL